MFVRHQFPLRSCCLALVLAVAPGCALAQSDSNPSGLPLPRFATTRSEPINVRVGPGTRYDVAWVFVQSGLPVEIIQEFDTWRKIRDREGEEGWVHQSLLSGQRAAYVTPRVGNADVALRANRADDAPVNAWLGTGYLVRLSGCDGSWCAAEASGAPAGGQTHTYKGYIVQADLWGVYPNEAFD